MRLNHYQMRLIADALHRASADLESDARESKDVSRSHAASCTSQASVVATLAAAFENHKTGELQK